MGAVDAIELAGIVAVATAGVIWRRKERQPALIPRAAFGKER
jgi:hypothetical protein